MEYNQTYFALSVSSAWSKLYDLPLCPVFNNPWIYGAYALKLLRLNGLNASEQEDLKHRFGLHALACRVDPALPGLMNRWPDGGGGMTSHDELMGMAYISPGLARALVAYLAQTDGVYINKPEETKGDQFSSLRHNVYRFPFMKPFLMACAGYTPGLLSQLAFAGHLVVDAFTTKSGDTSDAGGKLRIWIMLEHMERFRITNAAVKFWRSKMKDKGFKLCDMLAREPGDLCPVFGSESIGLEDF